MNISPSFSPSSHTTHSSRRAIFVDLDRSSKLEFSASDETEARSSLSKVNLVINMSSPVPGFEEQAKLSLDALEKKGINLISL